MLGRREKVKNVPKPSPKTKLSREDLNSEAVQKWVLSETLQHPATIWTGAGAVVSGLYLGAFGVSSAGLAATLGLVFVSGASWSVNYFIRGKKLAQDRVSSVMRQLQNAEVDELEQLVEECLNGGFSEGAKEGRELLTAYLAFQSFLPDVDGTGENLSAMRFKELGRDALQQGVSCLVRARFMWQALSGVDIQVIQKELNQMRCKLAKGGEETSAEKGRLEQQIASHDSRVKSYESQQARLGEILAEIDQLESALERARLESVELVRQDATSSLESGTAASRLEKAVAAAKRVELRLRGMDQSDRVSDSIYDTPTKERE
jgi:hypothetical protein